MRDTPAALGYRMPAEWERHEATWISWPKNADTFPSKILPAVEEAYVKMVDVLSKGEEVRILVDGAKEEGRVASLLRNDANVSFHRIRTVDVWVRDYGPTYLKGGDLALVRWSFNAWGRKYNDLLPDDEAGDRIATSSGLKVFRPGVVLEGGSIDVNGSGTVLTTEQCLLNANRNPSLSKARLEDILREYLGIRNVVWLKEGIEGDDTDGHVDDIARFVAPGTVAMASERNREDSNHPTLETNRKLLELSRDEHGRRLQAVDVPMPDKVSSSEGRLPASHLNFYIGNEVVLVPTFGGDSDRRALRALEGAFPKRDVVGIDCRALVYGLGTIHCVTQQVPSM
jgi:agmatine deiminase